MVFRRELVIFSLLSFITNFNSAFVNTSLGTSLDRLDFFISNSLKRRGYVHYEASISLWRNTIMSAWFAGEVFGIVFTPGLTDRYGRRFSYLISIGTSVIATCVQLWGIYLEDPEGVIIGRLLSALVSPLSHACLVLYIQESSSVHIRGSMSYLCEIGFLFMNLAGYTVGMLDFAVDSLYQLFVLQLAIQLSFLIPMLFIPETPKYLLLTKEDREASERSMNFFQGTTSFRYGLLNEINIEAWTEEVSPTFWEMVRTLHLRNALILTVMVLVPTLSMTTMVSTASLVVGQAGATKWQTSEAPLIMLTVVLFSSICGSTLVDLYPRRALLLISGTACSILLVFFAIFTNLSQMDFAYRLPERLRFVVLITYSAFFGIGVGPFSWFLGCELVSQRHRSTMYSATFAAQQVLGAAMTAMEETMNKEIGSASLIIMFVIPAFFALLYLYFYLPETMARESSEIVNQMASRGSFALTRNESIYSVSASMYSSMSVY